VTKAQFETKQEVGRSLAIEIDPAPTNDRGRDQ
jgi:hypothetical protein